ncbi:MAG TPA: DUF4345 domain-containing protein [Candidatus Eisenbacteria bacterium]|nr:DUF4345 domain-containing protein [Candidatus Eisenbacteria bacterium]
MLTLLVAIVIVFCLGMGVIALAAPERVAAIFGTTTTPAARNEIRAVYGGFGIVIAAMLAWGLRDPAMRPGIFLTVAASFAGMALGRVVSAGLERPGGFYPSWFYCTVELAMAGTLWAARFP